jgi:nucleotide-binding universal stress UspA family protein
MLPSGDWEVFDVRQIKSNSGHWAAARVADKLIYLKKVRARFEYLKQARKLTFGRQLLVARPTIERWSMYRHILIPTDGSELAEHAVTNGLSLAKSLGAKVSVIIVEEPFDWLSVSETQAQQALGELAKHGEQIKKHAASVLNRVANAAKQAVVSCDTIQVENEQPFKAIIATAADRGCDLIVMASHGRSGLSAIVLGSVTNKVLTHTKTPVLVCH